MVILISNYLFAFILDGLTRYNFSGSATLVGVCLGKDCNIPLNLNLSKVIPAGHVAKSLSQSHNQN